MARTNQTPSRSAAATKRKRYGKNPGHRFRPGTVALRMIR